MQECSAEMHLITGQQRIYSMYTTLKDKVSYQARHSGENNLFQ